MSDIIQNSVDGMVAGAVTTIGGYAGDAVSGIGNMVESAGRQVGQGNSDFAPGKWPILRLPGGITHTVNNWGSSITSYGDTAKNATAASTPSYGATTAVRKLDTSKKEKAPEKKGPPKALPSTKSMKALPAPPRMSQRSSGDSVISKALPSTKPMKALPSPPRMSRRSSGDSVISKATSTIEKPYDPTHSSYKPSGSSYSTAVNKKPEQNMKHTDGKVRINPESRPGRAKTAPGAPLTASNPKTAPASSTAGSTAPSVAGTSVGLSVAPSIPGRYPRGKVKISAESRPKPTGDAKR